MSIQTQTSNYFRTAAHPVVGNVLKGGRRLELPGGVMLWAAAGKVFLVILPMVLALNLWLSSAVGALESRIHSEEQVFLQVRSENTALRLEMDRLLSPVRLQVVAAEKLALRKPGPDQIQRM